eukprot:Protomagalhaensia_sp_Gyna_25__4748@NODE_469_length_3351_cov_22_814010_g363_i0_p1_GENE_NODE_469_length_3351_cov_22_814010_g363_i0NODE_469_length_3351_cov_22_814010_g363_i0_p1_ORF_typecomplete_len559_score80_18CLPTM1/PF05602_12/6_9e37PQloop/PF04193_14/0_0055PQloop/PF04193_14/1_9e03Peptidase_A22B/PF04258_13/9_9e02Peptidase_A22B/PF04258_13/0_3_NODE_469_length_3351_cov_22_814010_g363_i02501926
MFKTWGVAGLLVLWFGHSLRQFYLQTSPPLCKDSNCLTPLVPHGSEYDLELSVVGRHGHPSETLGHISATFGAEQSCEEGALKVEGGVNTIGRIQPLKRSFGRKLLALGRPAKCAAQLEWTLPDVWRSNSTSIYLVARAFERGQKEKSIFLRTSLPVSLMYTPELDRRSETRFLLTGEKDTSLAPTARVTSLSVPRLVRVGPIDIQEGLDPDGLRQKGASQWQVKQSPHYVASLLIDTLASPRDEYQSLLSPDPVTVTFQLQPISWRKAALQRLMINGVEVMERQFGTSKYESDSLKLLLAGESPIILLVTFTVSVLHLIFEFLAMSSNWVHFQDATQSQDRSDRVSARSVLLDIIFEVAVLIWLRDTGEAKIVQYILLARVLFNSWKYWKLRRIQTCTKESKEKPLGLIDSCKCLLDPSQLRSLRKKLSVDEFEAVCLKGLTAMLIPLMLSLCLYQLFYVAQRSWVSWLIKSCAYASYIGGFIAMTPQLYKNFYFQSVEHLPWPTLTYQFLNTIIDDLFSFVIRMPKEHRMSVFRDDIIFVIYWIQKRYYQKKPKEE